MKRKFILLKLISLCFFCYFHVSCSSESEIELESDDKLNIYEFNSEELLLFYKINNHLANLGKNDLTINAYMSNLCLTHNKYMIENNIVSHYNFHHRSQSIKNKLEVIYVAENIAYNYATINAVMNSWLQSDSHKENLEGDFIYIGISIRLHPENQRKYYTCIFAK